MQESSEKIKSLVRAGDFDSRLRLREEIRHKIDRIDVFAQGVPEALMKDLPLSAPGWPTFKITFANHCERWVFNESRKPTAEPALLDANLREEEIPQIGDDEEVIDAEEYLNGTQASLL